MIKITTDVVLIPLIGIGSVACVCLALLVMNAIAIDWATVTLL